MFNDIYFERVNCTKEALEELKELHSTNKFMVYCAELHLWAMDNEKALIYQEEPYILKSSALIEPGVDKKPAITIKRLGKYAFSVDSEETAKELYKQASNILNSNNGDKGRLTLNGKVLPASGTVKLSISPAYRVSKENVDYVLKVFKSELSEIEETLKSIDDKEYSKDLQEQHEAIEKKIKDFLSMAEKNKIKSISLATRNGLQYRFNYYDTIKEKRQQVGFGDLIIFYNSTNKPVLGFKEGSKKRTDTRENDPGLIYHGYYKGFERYITINLT